MVLKRPRRAPVARNRGRARPKTLWQSSGNGPPIHAADDLLSTCSTLACLRQKAEVLLVVTAFCIIFGLDIAATKLGTYHVHWGNKNRGLLDARCEPFRESDGYIDTRDCNTVYAGNWVGAKVPVVLLDKGMMCYLGIRRDISYTGQTKLDMTWERLEIALARIQTFPCTIDIKKTALGRCIYMSLLYQLKFANWSLVTFCTLDQKKSACIECILGLYQSYPMDLLYLPGKYGENGWLRLSDVIAKLAIQNMHRRGAPQGFNGLHPMTVRLIGRALFSGGVVVPPGEHVELVHAKDGWLSSPVDWLKERGLSITMEDVKRFSLAIPSDAGAVDVEDMQRIISLACESPSSTEEVPLRIGQCWSFSRLGGQLGSTSVYEIVSFNEQIDQVSLLQWAVSPDSKLAVGNKVYASPYKVSGYYHCGTTTNLRRLTDKRGSENIT